LHSRGGCSAGLHYGPRARGILMTLSLGLTVFAGNAWAGNVGSNDAARLVQGVNASVRYQLYLPNQSTAPQKIDIAMAPVLGAIKNGLNRGVATTDLMFAGGSEHENCPKYNTYRLARAARSARAGRSQIFGPVLRRTAAVRGFFEVVHNGADD
jgi:hypothetical protein